MKLDLRKEREQKADKGVLKTEDATAGEAIRDVTWGRIETGEISGRPGYALGLVL